MVVAIAWIILASPVYPPATPGTVERHAAWAPKPCVECHPAGRTATDAATRIAPGAGLLRMPAAIRFDHAAHTARGADCAACHQPGVLPTKAQCATCHDVQRLDSCVGCHPTDPAGRLRTDLPGGRLRPASHSPSFTRTHGNSETESCATCHAPPDCQRCHLANRRPIGIHPGDYLMGHGPDARRNNPDCASCHRLQTFCVGCHAQSGLTQSAPGRAFGFDRRDRQRYHPVGFVGALGGVPGPGHHRFAARQSLETCVSCHQETDCVRCHSAGATRRLRASPHPAGFAADCRRLADRNPRGCAKCHGGDVGRLCR